jgi:hypothetical protein
LTSWPRFPIVEDESNRRFRHRLWWNNLTVGWIRELWERGKGRVWGDWMMFWILTDFWDRLCGTREVCLPVRALNFFSGWISMCVVFFDIPIPVR